MVMVDEKTLCISKNIFDNIKSFACHALYVT